MENKFQTSFIPKKSLEDTGKVHVPTPLSIFFVISTIIAIVAVLSSAAIFGYSYYLNKRIVAVQGRVAAKQGVLNDSQVNNIVRVNNKLQAASNLLKNHTAVTGLFSFLEDNTLKNLRFNSFQFAYLSPTRVSVSMKGQARSFGAVAKQSEAFASATKPYFKEPVFSDLGLDDSGRVNFSFTTSVNPSLVSYQQNLPGAKAIAAPTSVSTTTSSTTNSTNR